MAVYTLVFSVYLRIGMQHYAVFLIAGLLPWLWFLSSAQIGTGAVVNGAMFVGKTTVPAVILVLVPILSNFVNFLLSLPILLVIAGLFHMSMGIPILMLPVLVAIQFLLTFGVVLVLSTLNVFFRDLQQLVSVVLMLLFYVAPIFYPLTSIPPAYRLYALLNPMVPIVLSYQHIFYENTLPPLYSVLYPLCAAVIVLYLGSAVFERYKDAFADYV